MLHRWDDAHHTDRLPGFWSLRVEKLNVPSERALIRPEMLRKRIVDNRHGFRRAGFEFGCTEVPPGKHANSEGGSVRIADGYEAGVDRCRWRRRAGRSHDAAVPEARERKTRSQSGGHHAGDGPQPIEQRPMKLSRPVAPRSASPGSISAISPPSRRKPGSAFAAAMALARNSPPDASRSTDRAT